MSTHTPGPWTTRKDGTIESKDGETVASFVDQPGDAAFIVRACNSHEAMLEALKAACQDIRLAAEIHKAKGLEAASHELRTHEQIYQNVIRLTEGRP